MKQCKSCLKLKPFNQFYKVKIWMHGTCNECKLEARRKKKWKFGVDCYAIYVSKEKFLTSRLVDKSIRIGSDIY